MQTNVTVRTKEQFEHLLRIGLSPITDDAGILVDLGFVRSYPNARNGHEATVWERSNDYGYRATAHGLRRVFACQRAFLVTPAR